MTRYDDKLQSLAICLSALAGFVDAIGFINLGGFFVSFMSGNSTRLAVGLAENTGNAAMAAGLIGTFLLGVMAGSFTGHMARARRRPVVLVLIALLLAAAASLNAMHLHGAVICMGLAMGAENAIFEEDGEVRIGLTYMTGTLVKLGQRLTARMLGDSEATWLPYFALWLGLVLGATTGALIFPRLGLKALWGASAVAALLAVAAFRIGPDATQI